MSKVTIQTLIPSREDNQKALAYLKEFAVIFGRAIRSSFAIRNRLGRTKTKDKILRSEIASQIQSRFGLSNSEAKNAALRGIAAYASQAALVDIYIEEAKEKISKTRQGIHKANAKIKKAASINDKFELRRLTKSVHYKHNRIAATEAKIKRLKAALITGNFTVCFGSKRLARKQHSLEENSYASHEGWLKDWVAARSHQIFYEGANNFAGGNQLVRYNAKSQTLTITVSPCLKHKYGEKVILHGVNFRYGSELIQAAIHTVRKESTRKGNDGRKKKTCRWGSKQPVSYNINIKGNKVYLNATVDQIQPEQFTSLEQGALGIDFNPTSIDWTLIDRHGNLKQHGSIKINVQDKRSNQTKDIIGKAVAQIVRVAEANSVPVVIEDLDFTKKKAALKEKGKKHARMLSNMAYSQFTEMLESRCSKLGVELIKVDPAYTSVIGVTKYMAMYGLNCGCAAALVVARRGQGRTEKLPTSHARYFKRPEDRLKSRAWQVFAKKVKLCGAHLRHYWYFSGQKQVRSNSPLHGKLRQTCRLSVGFKPHTKQTVQVLRTPHIRKKTSANGSLRIST
jgi:IS605 OrfB family transposase